MWSINEFCEPLDHEFSGIEPLPDNLRGVRLDEDWGLKQHCGRRELKSVDFLIQTKTGYCFLEFTDIGRQIDNTLKKIATVSESSDLPRPLKREITKKLRNDVSSEARDKYLQTCQIFSQAQKQLCDVPQLSNGCKFLIVYAPLNQQLRNSDIEIYRFLDYMKNSLITAIPDEMFLKIEIITLDMFLKHFTVQPLP